MSQKKKNNNNTIMRQEKHVTFFGFSINVLFRDMKTENYRSDMFPNTHSKFSCLTFTNKKLYFVLFLS